MNTLNLCYFDNEFGEYDSFNPRYVFNQKHTKEIVTILSKSNPYHFNSDTLLKKLKINTETLNNSINLLYNISAISEDNGCLRLNFPFFLTKDVKTIKKIVISELDNLQNYFADKFENLTKFAKSLYPTINPKLTLYHLLCGKMFDGMFFDYLEEKNLLKMSYPKKDNRDYVVIGYESNHYCNQFNNSLLCSFNNARYEKNSLSSFGTPNNYRYDYFRYFKYRQSNIIPKKYKKINNLLYDINDRDIVKYSIDNLQKPSLNKYNTVLRLFSYISKNNKIIVPVFNNYNNKLKDLYIFTTNLIGDKIVDSLNNIKKEILSSELMCLKHKVNIDEIFNEVWHIYFGLLNKFFVKKKFVASPKKIIGEGKYLKCIYLDK